jgi:ribose 5-phosphate isomerase
MNLMLEEAFKNLKLNKIPEIDSAIDGADGLVKMEQKALYNCCE